MTIQSELVQRLGDKEMEYFSGAEVFRASVSDAAVQAYSNDVISPKERVQLACKLMHDGGYIAHKGNMKDGSVALTFRDQSTLTITPEATVKEVSGAKEGSPFRLNGEDIKDLDDAMKDHYVEKFRADSRAEVGEVAVSTHAVEQER